MYQKFTHGWVIQTLNEDGKCVYQEFVADEQIEVEYEDLDGNSINKPENDQNYPFDMRQPMNDREDWEE